MKRFVSFLLACLMLIPLLAACRGDTDPAGSGDASSLPETEPPVEYYDIIKDGVSDYTIVRADQVGAGVITAIINLRKTIKAKYSVDLPFDTDWSKDNKENNTVSSSADVHEILIGSTNREETRTIAREYSEIAGYVIKAVNGKIVVWAPKVDWLIAGIEYFEKNLLGEGSLSFETTFVNVFDLNGDGMPLNVLANNYTVIYSSKETDKIFSAALALSSSIGAYSGKTVPTVSDSRQSDHSGKEILVGLTDRAESIEADRDLKYMDYTVRIKGNKIVLLGGSPLATLNAIDHFNTALATGKIHSLDEEYEYTCNVHKLIEDSLAFKPESFTPSWAEKFTPPEWMLDFEEKLYALVSPTGRMTADAHRGDVQNYPENSLEGILSAIMMGCDVIEIDIRLTKDNIMVLMHDASLNRTTDWNQKKGRDGLPTSENVADWTYEQLCELNLKFNGKVTEYKIPTLYEAAMLFKGRAQIHFDCKVNTIDKNSDVYLLAEELGIKECFYYYYGSGVMNQWLGFNKDDDEFRMFLSKMAGYMGLPGHGLRKRNFEMIEKHGDHSDGWLKAWDEGYKMTFTNKIYDFCQYIAKNCEPIKLP